MIKTYIDTITVGNCLNLLKILPDNSVDMVFADPPFNLKKKYGNYNDYLKNQEYLNWCKIWILELVRITKRTGSIFLHNIPKWLIIRLGLSALTFTRCAVKHRPSGR